MSAIPANEGNEDQDTWDVIVVGAGPPGENAAQFAIQGSERTAVLVESELVGGECSYWACMPSKGLLRPIEVLDGARDLGGTATVVGPRVDVAAVLARRDVIVNHHDDGSQVKWATANRIDVVRGRGRLAGERTVEVTQPDGSTRTLHARQAVVLATGTSARIPPIPGLAEARPWISRDVTNIHEIPRRVIVIGGGVVACEAATWLSGLGVAELTIIESSDRLLGRDEPFAGQMVAEHLTKAGVKVVLGQAVTSVSRSDPRDGGEGRIHGGAVEVTVGSQMFTADEVVVATGRVPNSRDLGWDTVGVAIDRFAAVDDHLNVLVPGEGSGGDIVGEWLYSVGDLNGRALLTHMGKYQARIAGAVIAARAEGLPLDGLDYLDVADHGVIPQVTFTQPQVGSVGRTEAEARAAGIDVETVEYDMAALAGTYLQRDHYVGRAKLVIDRAAEVIVGATFVGPEISDLVHAATVAVVGKVPLSTLWHAVPSYPTVSEIWLRLLETHADQDRGGAAPLRSRAR
jgi:pyruvate/2-oxoglutarate dehydrogenase complex dihydrolipoamide dehydrogenase (E3) component